jgi:hypothetical protein
MLIELFFSWDALDWSWVCSDSFACSPLFKLCEVEQLDIDVVSPFSKDRFLRLW